MTLDTELIVSGVIVLIKTAGNTLLFSCISLLVYFKASTKFLNPFSEQDGLSERLFLRGHEEQSTNACITALYQL